MASGAFRISIVGSDADVARVRESAAFAAEHFLVERASADDVGMPASGSPDVTVIGAAVAKPLPIASKIRLASPQSQIVFLIPGERLERFRATLPFVPNLASAWSASAAASSANLAQVLGQAARASRKRAASQMVLGRINERLAAREGKTADAAAADARGSQLALSERYLATILSQSPDAFVAVDTAGSVIAFNDAAGALFGSGLDGGNIFNGEMVVDEEKSALKELIERAAAGERLFDVPLRLRGNRAGPRYAELSLAPVHGTTGVVASVSITARDVTERRRAEERQQLLISELNHRVKNTLAIVQALAHQSFKDDRPVAEQRAAFGARLSALAAAHDLLTQESWASASLEQLVRSSLHSCGADQDRMDVAGPEVVLAPQQAVSVAIALHELCTNAIKYGALSKAGGRVAVEWRVEQPDAGQRLVLEWIESGGPVVEAAKRRGFGLRMLERGLASDLNGSVAIDFAAGGVKCRIEAPLRKS